MQIRKSAFIFLCSVFFSTASFAGTQDFTVDKSHTVIIFSVSHFGFSKVMGRFNDFAGTYTIDDDKMTASKIDLTINTATVDTGHQKRDEHLRGEDFFNVTEFPTMTFSSTDVIKTGPSTAKVTGNLTLLGITKPVTLDVTLNKTGEYPMPQYKGIAVTGFSVRGTIKRSDFGMNYAQGGIGDEIELMIELEGQAKK